jgi:hypothetical protein
MGFIVQSFIKAVFNMKSGPFTIPLGWGNMQKADHSIVITTISKVMKGKYVA